MRRTASAIVLAIASLIVFAEPAVSHGSCSAPASRPFKPTTSVVRFSGMLDCNEAHHSIDVLVDAYRRIPGGSWVFIGRASHQKHEGTDYQRQIDFAFDCNKDYQTRTAGFAWEGGQGHSPAQTSSILTHTC